MTQPRVFGRLLPKNDWEGDDGVYTNLTCMDTAAGRALSWATNGRKDIDGRKIRAALSPADRDGVNIEQVRQAVKKLSGQNILIKRSPGLPLVKTMLGKGAGLIIWGRYNSLPRSFRHQTGGDFAHAMFASHRSSSLRAIRIWDPLNPNLEGHGRWIPEKYVYEFMNDYDYDFGYIPLQPLVV